MSMQMTRQAWKLALPPTEKLVMLCLADHADKDGRCWPSIRRIGERTGLKERAIQMALKSLAERGLVERENRPGKGVVYHVHPRIKCTPSRASTPASDAPHPRTKCATPPHDMHPTPALNAPKPTNRTIKEPTNQPDAFARVCRAAGWHPSTESKAKAARADLQSWIDAGFDLDRDVFPGIAKAIAERPSERTSSLRRFTTTIANEARKAVRTETNGASRKPPEKPILEVDGEEHAMRQLRADLLERMGEASYCMFVNRVRFERVNMGDGSDRLPLRITEAMNGPSPLLDSDRVSVVRNVARKHGFNEVW